MKILVTGAKGFVGKNLCWALKNIKEGKDRRFPELAIEEVYEYDLDSTPEELDAWCKECDFVFNLAGVNRPQNQEEFMQGNFGFASTLLDTLKRHGNRCPVMLSSSQQASLTGRFGNSEYGRSKKAGEDLFLEYEREFLQAEANSSKATGRRESGNLFTLHSSLVKYPVRYFTSDTTGEKAYEEFYVPGEKIDMQRFQALGVVEQTTRHDMTEVNCFFDKLEDIFGKEDFTKSQIVDAIRDFIPNFQHEEKGKNLDQKM